MERNKLIRLVEEAASVAARQAGHAAANLYDARKYAEGAGLKTKALELQHLCEELTKLQQRISIASSVSAADLSP